jgi:hypothetical protein
MLQELELLIRKKEANDQRKLDIKNSGITSSGNYINSLIKNDNKPPLVMGGEIINEDEFADEDLCQICCALK